MDHKVSKDMISSGMIPSGEKTQADLVEHSMVLLLLLIS